MEGPSSGRGKRNDLYKSNPSLPALFLSLPYRASNQRQAERPYNLENAFSARVNFAPLGTKKSYRYTYRI